MIPFRTRRLHLILGYACNHHCRYCVQEIHGRPSGAKKVITARTIKTIVSAANQVFPEKLKITFFGGEPLLYAKEIKEVLKAVQCQNIKWKIHTNGELLTSELVDLFNENNVHVGISHDGANVLKTRGVDVFEDRQKVELFNELNDRAIDFVVTSYTQDFYEVRSYFCDLFGNENWRLKGAFLVNPGEVPDDMLNFDFVRWEETVHKICSRAIEQIHFKTTMLPSHWESQMVLRAMGDAVNPLSENPFIRLNERCLVPHLDLKGQLSFCERFEAELKHRSSHGFDPNETNDKFTQRTIELHPNCFKCDVYPFCRGQCPVSTPVNASQQCQLLKIYYSHIHGAFRYLNAIEPSILKEAMRDSLSAEMMGSNEPTNIVWLKSSTASIDDRLHLLKISQERSDEV